MHDILHNNVMVSQNRQLKVGNRYDETLMLWSEDDHALWVKLVKKFGTDFDKISEEMGTKSMQ